MMMIKRRKIEEKLEVENVLVTNPHIIASRIHEFTPPIKNTRLKMVSGANYLPKDNEWKPRGEDAHFICSEEHTIGVADGVSGWAKKGIDAGEYARELMINAAMSVHNEPKKGGFVDPIRVLSSAYSNTNAQGSSTACIITLRDNYLHAANVGDSGFFVFRKGELAYQSPVQQRHFNCPYQLGNSEKSDRPSSAVELRVEVEPGDIIVAGTDGLLDNMFATEIKEVLAVATKDGSVEPDQLAFTIANYALYNSFDRFSETPFARNARRAGKYHKGGKIDDITVIVSHIVQV